MEKTWPLCEFCQEKPAGVSLLNQTGIQVCQMCMEPLCDDCLVGGLDEMPRCGGCHEEKLKYCVGDCRGDRSRHHCRVCEYDFYE